MKLPLIVNVVFLLHQALASKIHLRLPPLAKITDRKRQIWLVGQILQNPPVPENYLHLLGWLDEAEEEAKLVTTNALSLWQPREEKMKLKMDYPLFVSWIGEVIERPAMQVLLHVNQIQKSVYLFRALQSWICMGGDDERARKIPLATAMSWLFCKEPVKYSPQINARRDLMPPPPIIRQPLRRPTPQRQVASLEALFKNYGPMMEKIVRVYAVELLDERGRWFQHMVSKRSLSSPDASKAIFRGLFEHPHQVGLLDLDALLLRWLGVLTASVNGLRPEYLGMIRKYLEPPKEKKSKNAGERNQEKRLHHFVKPVIKVLLEDCLLKHNLWIDGLSASCRQHVTEMLCWNADQIDTDQILLIIAAKSSQSKVKSKGTPRSRDLRNLGLVTRRILGRRTFISADLLDRLREKDLDFYLECLGDELVSRRISLDTLLDC